MKMNETLQKMALYRIKTEFVFWSLFITIYYLFYEIIYTKNIIHVHEY